MGIVSATAPRPASAAKGGDAKAEPRRQAATYGAGRRFLAAAACAPVPLLGLALAVAAPDDRLVRFHGVQATVWLLLALASLALLGGLRIILDGPAGALVDALSGGAVVAACVGLGWAAWGAAHGRFVRLRPAWDVLALQSGRR